MFHIINIKNEGRMATITSSDIEIKETRNLVPRKIIRVSSVGKRQMYDLEVAHPGHNFILPNGVITSNSHAVSYSYISYYTAWLKHYYPTEFMCAIINAENPNSDSVQEYKQAAIEMGLIIKPPDINTSGLKYEIIGDKTIVTGLLAIKGLGDTAIEYIIANRKYNTFPEFIIKSIGTKGNRSPITKTVIENLARAGCFDSLGVTRKNALEHWQDVKTKISSALKRALKNNTAVDLDGIMSEFDPGNEFTKKEILQNEMLVIGQYLSGTHNDIYGGFFKNSPDIVGLSHINDIAAGQTIKIEAVIKLKSKELKIKKKGKNFGRVFAKYLMEDSSGKTAELTLWPEHYEKFRHIFVDGTPIRALCDVNEYLDTKSLVLRKVEDIPEVMQNGILITKI